MSEKSLGASLQPGGFGQRAVPEASLGHTPAVVRAEGHSHTDTSRVRAAYCVGQSFPG